MRGESAKVGKEQKRPALFFNYLKEIFIHNFGFSNSLVSGLTYLLFISTLLTTVLGYKADWVYDIEPTVFFLAAKLTGVALLVWAPYSVWKEKASALAGYKSSATHELMFTFDDEENIVAKKLPRGSERWLFTIGIQNQSSCISVTEVAVQLVSITNMGGTNELDIPLLDNCYDQSKIEISPGAVEKFRVFSCKKGVELPSLVFAPSGEDLRGRPGYRALAGIHRFTLIAKARDQAPKYSDYYLELIPNHRPIFRPWAAEDQLT